MTPAEIDALIAEARTFEAQLQLLGDQMTPTSALECRRKKSDVTPCVVTDGPICYSEDRHCVGCDWAGRQWNRLRKALRRKAAA